MNKKFDDSYHIVFIDDNKEFLASLSMTISSSKLLEKNEFNLEFHFLNDSDECYDLIKDLVDSGEKLALIISDQKMPNIMGIDFLEKTKEIAPKASRILLTGFASLESARNAINSHLLEQYITKPIEDYERFIATIRNVVSNYHLREEKERADILIKEQVEALKTANERIEKMQHAAETVAYMSQGLRRLDLDEVLDLVITSIPPLFNAAHASLFLYDHETNTLHLKRSNISLEKVKKELNINDGTPMSVAIKENRPFIVLDINESPHDFLHKDELGSSCVVIPFIAGSEDHARKSEIKDIMMNLKDAKGILNMSNLNPIDNIEILQYKANMIKDIIGINILNAQLYEKTRKLAVIDDLTGLYNKHIFIEFLKRECDKSNRNNSTFFLAISDIDDFKAINDNYGHRTGDLILQQLGGIFQNVFRKSDIISRFGGDEFVYILRGEDLNKTLNILQKVKIEISNYDFTDSIKVGISIGVSNFSTQKGDTWEKLLDNADKALYKAKGSGKNSIKFLHSENL